jgi:hypothetical protein
MVIGHDNPRSNLVAQGLWLSSDQAQQASEGRVGPTFVAHFADGQVTRMSTFTSVEKLDYSRGIRLSQAAYESRTKQVPVEIVAAHFEQDGAVLQRY